VTKKRDKRGKKAGLPWVKTTKGKKQGSPLFSMAWKAGFHAEGMSLEPQRGSALQPKVA